MTKEILKKVIPAKYHRFLKLADSNIATKVIPQVRVSRTTGIGVVSSNPPKKQIKVIKLDNTLDDYNKRKLADTGLHPSPFEIL